MQIEVFQENSNLFPEVARSKCRDLFFCKFYAFAMVFLEDISPTMHSVDTQVVCNGNSIGANMNNSKGSPRASRSVAKTGCFEIQTT